VPYIGTEKQATEPKWAFADMDAAIQKLIAPLSKRGLPFTSYCRTADLVARFDYYDALESVVFVVVDSKSGNKVFDETRSVTDLGSDTYQLAMCGFRKF
jgi:hypothetical protein